MLAYGTTLLESNLIYGTKYNERIMLLIFRKSSIQITNQYKHTNVSRILKFFQYNFRN